MAETHQLLRSKLDANPYYMAFKQAREGNDFHARFDMVLSFAWAVPNAEAIEAILELEQPVVEMGAGNGYWAWLLRQNGAEVAAFDKSPQGEDQHTGECFTEVLYGTHTLLCGNFRDHALMLCWPPYSDNMALDCLRAYEGDTVVYIGEGPGGCTGTEAFFDDLCQAWERTRLVYLPTWDGIHDYLSIYRRK